MEAKDVIMNRLMSEGVFRGMVNELRPTDKAIIRSIRQQFNGLQQVSAFPDHARIAVALLFLQVTDEGKP